LAGKEAVFAEEMSAVEDTQAKLELTLHGLSLTSKTSVC
jgi:hypothetical protein